MGLRYGGSACTSSNKRDVVFTTRADGFKSRTEHVYDVESRLSGARSEDEPSVVLASATRIMNGSALMVRFAKGIWHYDRVASLSKSVPRQPALNAT